MKYKRLVIYYHTGTGNALLVARRMTKFAEEDRLETSIHSIDHDYHPDLSELTKDTLVGFIFPTHGFNASPAMIKFLVKFPSVHGVSAFAMNTRAGLKLSKCFLPGASGLALWIVGLLLIIKGFAVKGLRPMDMPSNWISLHPGLTESCAKQISSHCEAKTNVFIERLLSGKKSFKRAIIDIPIDVFLSPIGVVYYLIGRFFLAKTFVYSYECDTCQICIKNCPVGAIELRDSKPFWKYNCESCMRCINICPKRSILSSHLLFATWVWMAMSVNDWFSPCYWLGLVTNAEWVQNSTLRFVSDSTLIIPVMFLVYRLMHPLLRFPLVNKIFKYTSLTYYWRHYLAPNISLRDFKINKAAK